MSGREAACWAVGGIGAALAALGWLLDPGDFHYAWLAALTTWWGWPLGSMALLLIHRLTGGGWGEALSPSLRAGTASLPLLLPGLVPVVAGLAIYPWAGEAGAALPNHLYLNTPFLLVRLAIYVALWLTLAALVLRTHGTVLAAAGLPLLALSFTFAAIDLILSLEPAFNSSIFGMLQGTDAVLLALSVAIAATSLRAPEAGLADLGKLMLALVVLWAYLDFMQLLIVWESDLPSEAPWYKLRMQGGWGAAFAIIALLHFLLPFVLLIVPRMQRSRRALAFIALLLVGSGMLRGVWTVLPETRSSVWIDLACLLTFTGLSAAWLLHTERNLPRLVHV